MERMQNNQNNLCAIFIPRFNLSNSSLVGIEVKIKQRQHVLSCYEAYALIRSGTCHYLLEQIATYFSQWNQKTDNPLYLSWEVCSQINAEELEFFLNELSLHFPLDRLELVLDAHNLTASESIKKTHELFNGFQERHIRRGLFHSLPLDFDVNNLCTNIDLFKLKNGVIKELKNDLKTASRGFGFIAKLGAEKVDIVADDLYSTIDVATSILMGIQYGQGFFLSRNKSKKITITPRTLRRKPGTDIYERQAINCFDNLIWT